MTTRRGILLGAAGFALLRSAARAQGPFDALPGEFARIERESGGRLGVAVLDTGSGRRAAHRAGERFPMCSTFKFLAAAALLARVDRGREKLDRRIAYRKSDLVPYSPVTGKYAGSGMTVDSLCEAAVTLSDNTAANLILAALGGPAGLTRFMRAIGDTVTRLDRNEPTLNEARPGDPRDTTTPAAMLQSIDRLLFGAALAAPSRERLAQWLLANKTGDKRLRTGLPQDWRCGEKTGSGGHGTTNDVGAFWLPERKPVIVAAFLTETAADATAREAALASVARAIAAALAS